MVYTARKLITKAYYLSQVISRSLQTVTAEQVTDGLELLNALIDFKRSDLRLIPYYSNYFFNTVQGQELYVIPNLLAVDTLTFNIGDVRFSLQDQTRSGYFATYRIDNVQSLPYEYRIERQFNGANLYLYFVPSQVFQMKLWGKFGLSEVTLDQDMALTYDLYYIEYLRYLLAEYICSDWGATFPDESKMKLKELEKKCMDVSPPDLSVRTQNYFGSSPGLDWAVINLSNGYLPY